MIGAQIGVYRVQRQIGEGGMGSVWLAEHVMLGRQVAIKVLHREASLKPDLVTRFFNEAKAATAISDPGIIQIFDFGHHTDGSAFIVMELLEGEPLDLRLRRMGRLPLGASLRILRQVSSSLGAAHRRGIVHRDVKPENIFLVRDPEVVGGERTKVLDFGIAKLTADQRVKTQTSAMMGTPTFMSPEQCRGAGHVDQRSDVYSLGCVLFTLLTGRPPFDAEGAGEIIAMHLREPPSAPSTVLPGIPYEVDQLVLRCLHKDRAQRFESGAELAAALEQLSSSPMVAPLLGNASPPAPGMARQDQVAPFAPQSPFAPQPPQRAPAQQLAPPPQHTPPQHTPQPPQHTPPQQQHTPPPQLTPPQHRSAATPVPGYVPTPLPMPRSGHHEVTTVSRPPTDGGWDAAPPPPVQALSPAAQLVAAAAAPAVAAAVAPVRPPSIPGTPLPRAATGDERTTPFPVLSSPPVTLETVAPSHGVVSGAIAPQRVAHAALTTMSSSVASGDASVRKASLRWWWISGTIGVLAAVIVVGLMFGDPGPSGSSESSGPGSSGQGPAVEPSASGMPAAGSAPAASGAPAASSDPRGEHLGTPAVARPDAVAIDASLPDASRPAATPTPDAAPLVHTTTPPAPPSVEPRPAAATPSTSDAKPARPAVTPTASETKPARPVLAPVASDAKPARPALAPTASDAKPARPALAPTASDAKPARPALAPTASDAKPARPAVDSPAIKKRDKPKPKRGQFIDRDGDGIPDIR